MSDPWKNYTATSQVTNAQDFSQQLREERPGFRPVASAFEAMGKSSPTTTSPPKSSPTTTSPPSGMVTNEQLMAKLVDAMSGDRKATMPSWDGSPMGLRTWLKQLSFWEAETGAPKEKWGVKLYQSLTGDAKKIADTVSSEVLMSDNGYSGILTALMAKYQPYLEAIGPTSVDAFFFTGERQNKESFTAYLARKETQRQELEQQLGTVVNPLISGRILLKQANLNEYQQQILALKTNVLMEYEEVVKALRPLDRLDTLARTGALAGTATTTRTYVQAGEGDDNEDDGYEEDTEEELDEDSDESGFLEFEDKEHDEAEAIYVQAYNDVRRDLRNRRKERGFIRHGKKPNKGSGNAKKGRGKGRERKGDKYKKQGSSKPKDEFIRGTESELLARTRCFSCQELGHVSRNCPHRQQSTGSKKTTFVSVTGNGSPAKTTSTTSYVQFKHEAPRFPPSTQSVLRAIYAGVRVHGYEAILDTAAEECIIGSQAFQAVTEELATFGLRPIHVKKSAQPCAGIGGQATIRGLVDVPTCIGGLLGIIRFTIVEDTPTFVTPLIGVSYLEAVNAIIDLGHGHYTTPDGHFSRLRRLPSGHRAVHLLDFVTTPWKLPKDHQVDGCDPFRLPQEHDGSYVSIDEDAGEAMDDTFFQAYVESILVAGTSRRPAEARSRSRSRRSPIPSEHSCAETVPYSEGHGETGTEAGDDDAPPDQPPDLPPEAPRIGRQEELAIVPYLRSARGLHRSVGFRSVGFF